MRFHPNLPRTGLLLLTATVLMAGCADPGALGGIGSPASGNGGGSAGQGGFGNDGGFDNRGGIGNAHVGGSGGAEPACPPNEVECGGTCIDPTTDNNFCGATADCVGANEGQACAAGTICDGSGICELTCQAGLVDCNGVCTNPATDESYCGAGPDCAAEPGEACGAGEICNGAGICELSCQPGLVDCNGTCINPATDESYCGAGHDCAAEPGESCDNGEVCNGSGQCELSCQTGFVDCNGTCINPKTDATYCGAGPSCEKQPGETCGAGEVCNGSGVCELSCQNWLVDCNGKCIDPATDEAHCGAGLDCSAEPGKVCDAGETCNGEGVCELSCQAGLVDCGGRCVNPNTDEAHCGAGPDCAAAPGEACDAGEICNGAGSCELSCQAGLVDCEGTCIDPASNPLFCGAGLDCSTEPGKICGDAQACVAGTCKDLATVDHPVVIAQTDGQGVGNTNLFTLDPATGATELVGDLGLGFSGLAFANGVLYGAVGGNDGGVFASIDPATAAVSQIGGAFASHATPDLTWDPTTQTLFGWSESMTDTYDVPITIDLATGVATPLAASSPVNSAGSAMAADASGTIYFFPMGPDLYTVDPTSGLVTSLGSVAGVSKPHAATFHLGELLVIDNHGGSGGQMELGVVDVDALIYAPIAPLPDGSDAIASATP